MRLGELIAVAITAACMVGAVVYFIGVMLDVQI